MKVAIGSDEAIFVLSERTRFVDHEPTAEEIAAEARRIAQRERHWANPSRWAYPSYERAYPEKDKLWTGELFVQIEGYSDGVRRKWADGRTQRLEGLVPSIVDGIQILLAARKAQREEREERARQWAEQERRRALARARHEREKARMVFFENLVRLRRNANDLKAALGSVEINDANPEAQINRMMAWGRTRLQQMEQQLQSDRIEERLSEAKLFPPDGADELHDPFGGAVIEMVASFLQPEITKLSVSY